MGLGLEGLGLGFRGPGARVRGPEEAPLVCAAADIVVADDHADVVRGGVLHSGGVRG